MGFFGGKPGFIKEGKGVERDAKKKNAFFRFFELLLRKFTKLFLLNIVYVICISPLICGAVVLVTGTFQLSEEVIRGSFLISRIMWLASHIPLWLNFTLLAVDIVFFGPLTCGFTYMLRNYATERHAWFSDFFSKSMENFKQGFVMGIVDVVVCVSFILYAGLDISPLRGEGMYYFYVFMKSAAWVIALFYIFMRFYLYTIAVTFELPLKDVFKNASIFAVLGFFRNILATICCVATIFAFTSTWIIDLVLLVSILFSFCGFIGMFTTYPVIQKYMLPKEDTEDEVQTEEGEGSDA